MWTQENGYVQFFGGYFPNGSMYGFIDCNKYELIFVNARNTDMYMTLEDSKSLVSLSDMVDAPLKEFCIGVLCNMVMQCFWSNQNIVKGIRAKCNLLNINFIERDTFIRSEVEKFLETVISIEQFTYDSLVLLLKEAKAVGLRPKESM